MLSLSFLRSFIFGIGPKHVVLRVKRKDIVFILMIYVNACLIMLKFRHNMHPGYVFLVVLNLATFKFVKMLRI